MSYHKRGSSGYLVVRRKGNSPIRVVAGEHFRIKKKAEKEAREWNKAYKGSDVKFMVREEGWRRKLGILETPHFFCERKVIKVEGGELQKGNMKHKQKMYVIYAVAIIAVAVLLIMTLPLVPETRITVVTSLDVITNVSIDTPRIPLIVWLIPSSSVASGAYTINVNASLSGLLAFNATIQNVPSGQYTFIWVRYGQPEAGTYRVIVQLMRANTQVGSYQLDVTFG